MHKFSFYIKKYFYFYLEDNNHSVVLVSAIHQHESTIGCTHRVYTSSLLVELPSHFPPHPTLQVVTEHKAELPVLSRNFPLALCFTHGNVYISMLLSQFTPPSLSPETFVREPGDTSGKELACQCRRRKRHEFALWVGKIPWRRGSPMNAFIFSNYNFLWISTQEWGCWII